MVEVEVEFDYQAEEPDELTIKTGDIIKNVVQKPGGWWEGTLNGKTGVFPDNFVKLIDRKVVLRNKKDVARIRKCRVVFSYDGVHEDELSLKTGDIIDIHKEEEEGWWRGVLNGKEGVFPSNFVEEIPTAHFSDPQPSARAEAAKSKDPAPALPAKPGKSICEARYSYHAKNADELNLNEGDLITIISKEEADAGWWKGELNGKVGVFPDNYVEELSPHAEPKKVISPSSKIDSKPAADPSAIKSSSVASQRKSLVQKDAPKPAESKATPPLLGKKPSISQKKSPPATVGGIFSKIKDKIVGDVRDGVTSSKPKTETPKENNLAEQPVVASQTFDQVERRPLLSDVRANRARPPGRRLPTSIYKEDDDDDVPSLPNGTADHAKLENSLKSEDSFKSDKSASSENLDSSDLEAGGDAKPKLREWEKHKAPWLEEMKLNQAKRTSVSPVPEPKPKSQTANPTEPKAEPETSKSSQNSPAEREVLVPDMSKSMSDMKLSPMEVKPIPKPYRTPPGDAEKAPPIKSSIPREPLTKPTHQPQPQLIKTPPKPYENAVIPKPVQSSNSITSHTSNSITQTIEKSHSSTTTHVSSATASTSSKTTAKVEEKRLAILDEILHRLAKLENKCEKQEKMIVDLKNRLHIESELRIMLQEKIMQNNVQV